MNLYKGGILSESPDYTPDSAANFTLDMMILTGSLLTWAEDGEDQAVMKFFVAYEMGGKHMRF